PVVRRGETAHDLGAVVGGFARGKRPAGQPLPQRFPFEELGDGECRAVLGSEVVKRENVRVRERGDGPGFALESRERIGSLGAGGTRTDCGRLLLRDSEATWPRVFAERGRRYELPRLALFDGAVDPGRGRAQSAVGPFYSPRDSRVCRDLSLSRELSERFGAP